MRIYTTKEYAQKITDCCVSAFEITIYKDGESPRGNPRGIQIDSNLDNMKSICPIKIVIGKIETNDKAVSTGSLNGHDTTYYVADIKEACKVAVFLDSCSEEDFIDYVSLPVKNDASEKCEILMSVNDMDQLFEAEDDTENDDE